MDYLRKNMKIFKEILIKLNNWKFIILVIFIICGAFYWYEWRPSRAYSYCDKWAKDSVIEDYNNKVNGDLNKNYDYAYKSCLRNRGL